jgi:hypothetical protein
MYHVSFLKRILGLSFTITLVLVQSARSPERALRAAKIKFKRWSRISDWRVRADEVRIEQVRAVPG